MDYKLKKAVTKEQLKQLKTLFSKQAYSEICLKHDLLKHEAELLIKAAILKQNKIVKKQRKSNVPVTYSSLLSANVLRNIMQKSIKDFVNYRDDDLNWQEGVCELCRRSNQQKLIRTPLLHRKMVYTSFYICIRCRRFYFLKVLALYSIYVTIAILSSFAVGLGFGIISRYIHAK